jgi:hypothetical protein
MLFVLTMTIPLSAINDTIAFASLGPASHQGTVRRVSAVGTFNCRYRLSARTVSQLALHEQRLPIRDQAGSTDGLH